MDSAVEVEELPSGETRFVKQKDNFEQLSEISKNSQTTFIALILACVYSYLAIATTTDAALVSNSSATPLPIIQVNVPIVWFYYFAPFILAVLFVYFHLYLERFWRCVVRLPLEHPDGRRLDDYVYPWLISSTFIRGGIARWLSLLLAWWLVPSVLLFYWARYLVAHDWLGTLLHFALIVVTAVFAMRFFYVARNALLYMSKNSGAGEGGRTPDASADQINRALQLNRGQLVTTTISLGVLAAALLYLSGAAIWGLSDKTCEVADDESCDGFYRFGQRVWETFHLAPRSEVTEARFIAKPEHWHKVISNSADLDNYLDTQRTLVLNRRDLRNLSARKAFLPGSLIQRSTLDHADLQDAVLTGSRFEDVSLRRTNLTRADLQHAKIQNVRFDDVVAAATRFDQATFGPSSLKTRTQLSGDFTDASFDGARGDQLLVRSPNGSQNETSLRGASLRETRFESAEFDKVDLSRAKIRDAAMTSSKFTNTDFSNTIIERVRMDHSEFKNCRFISSDIQDSSFEYAKFSGSEFNHSGAALFVAADASLSRAPRKTVEMFRASSATFGGETQIRNMRFVQADLRFAVFNDVVIDNTLFTDSDLSHATFRNVDLSTVEFKGVDLSDADLTGARNVLPRLLEGACGNAKTALPPGMGIKPCLRK